VKKRWSGIGSHEKEKVLSGAKKTSKCKNLSTPKKDNGRKRGDSERYGNQKKPPQENTWGGTLKAVSNYHASKGEEKAA